MPAAVDLLRRRLWLAALRRRLPCWLAPAALLALAALLPAVLPLTLSLTLPAAAPGARWLLAVSPSATPVVLAPALALLAAWLVFDAWRWHRRVAREWAAWLDAAVPAFEDSSALLAAEARTPIARLQQQRLQARLAGTLAEGDYRAIARARVHGHGRSCLLPAVLALLAAGAAWAYAAGGVQQPAPVPSASRPVLQDGDVYLRVTPPAYTGAAAFETAARDIDVPQYTDVRWCVRKSAGGQPVVELGDGTTLAITPGCAARRVEEALFWRVRGAAVRHTIRVTPDQPPQVTVSAPDEPIHLLVPGAKTVRLAVQVRDDHAIVRASLHFTLARGSGENVRFTDREVPLPQSANPKVRDWSRQWTLAELGMEPGDELYFFVRATDNAPERPHTVQSPTYTVRLPGPEAEGLDATALPTMVKPESLRSQRQIIIDTEQLLADMRGRPGLAPAALRARSEGIAADQSALRLRYGEFLGEESSLFGDAHDHGAERGHEHGNDAHDDHGAKDGHDGGHGAEGGHGAAAGGTQSIGTEAGAMQRFGHAHDQEDNATIFDPQTKAILKRALAAMWDAEKALRALTPAAALAPEHKALAAIKALQAAERVYLHRTAFVPPALREEKRMSGEMDGAMGARRLQATASDAVPAEVRDLAQALAGDGALPALWSRTARDAIAAGLAEPEQRLAAQRAVQDVQDGCVSCRATLQAWLRATLPATPVLLQARPAAASPFGRAWQGKGERP